MRGTNDKAKKGAVRRFWMPVTGFLGMAALVLAGLGAVGGQGAEAPTAATQEDHSGWGSQVAATVHREVVERAPIGVANACGMGATSCFQCHNQSERGPEPAMDESTAPWHPQHMEVNHSCDGCHQGNPRVRIEDTAHRDMVVDPRSQPEETCGSCHEGGEVSELLTEYQGVGE